MSARCALVIGAAGQDGSYLSELLLEKDYRVVAVVRRDPGEAFPNLESIRDRIELVRADLADSDALARAIAAYKPTEVYNLAAVSFGPDAWSDPVRTTELGSLAVARLLEIVRQSDPAPRFFQASSAWVFGRPTESPQSEGTPYAPVEPYGAAKAFGDFLLRATELATTCSFARGSSTTTSRRGVRTGSLRARSRERRRRSSSGSPTHSSSATSALDGTGVTHVTTSRLHG